MEENQLAYSIWDVVSGQLIIAWKWTELNMGNVIAVMNVFNLSRTEKIDTLIKIKAIHKILFANEPEKDG